MEIYNAYFEHKIRWEINENSSAKLNLTQPYVAARTCKQAII